MMTIICTPRDVPDTGEAGAAHLLCSANIGGWVHLYDLRVLRPQERAVQAVELNPGCKETIMIVSS